MFRHLMVFVVCACVSYSVPDYKLIFMDDIPQFSEEEKRERVSSSCEDLATLLGAETRVFDLVQKSCDQLQKIDQAKKLVKCLQKLIF